MFQKGWLRAGLAGAVLLVLLAACGNFERATISGYVVEQKAGEPIAGVQVRVLETGAATTTDAHGHFAVEVPPGVYSLIFRKRGYATSKVEGLITFEEGTRYSTILRPAFDPALPTRPPELWVRVPKWFNPGKTIDLTVSGQVAAPGRNGFYFLDVALGQQGGSSGFLNGFVRHKRVFDFRGEATTVSLSTEGYSSVVPIYVVAYDANGNRTEVIRYLYRKPSEALPEPATPGNLTAQAVTFGDVAVFGPLSVPQLTASALVKAMKGRDLRTLEALAKAVKQSAVARPLGGSLEKAVTWVDLRFSYDPSLPPPEAFEILRKRGDEAQFFRVARVAAADALLDDPKNYRGHYGFRDASPGVEPGVELTYRVVAVNGKKRSDPAEVSVTPLAPYRVEAVSPADHAVDVPLAPYYKLTLSGSSQINLTAVIVLDRAQADGFNVEYFSPVFATRGADGPFNPLAAYGIEGVPHGLVEVDGGYALSGSKLQPFHAYDWQPFAVTVHLNGAGDVDAVSIASDFFDLWGIGFGVEDGPVNTFVTGAGGGQ